MSESSQINPSNAAPQAQPAVPSVYSIAAPQYVSAPDPRRKSPGMACLLSAMPGLGQVYVGYYQRGFINAAVVASLITLLATDLKELNPLAAVFLAFFWLYNIIDAGRRAALYNEVLAGRTGVELPTDLMAPGLGGSVIGGVAVALVGAILLSHTAFEMSLDWVEEWWPTALILFGVYLVYKAKQDSSAIKSSRELD